MAVIAVLAFVVVLFLAQFVLAVVDGLVGSFVVGIEVVVAGMGVVAVIGTGTVAVVGRCCKPPGGFGCKRRSAVGVVGIEAELGVEVQPG